MTSTDLAPTQGAAVPSVADPRAWTPQQANLMVFAGLATVNASSGQIMLVDPGVAEAFLQVVARTGLDPFAKQIYAVRFGGKYQIVVGIDGFRLIAQRSQQYAGQTKIEWLRADGTDEGRWVSAWVPALWGGSKGDKPLAARVGIMRKGFTEPLYTVVTWDEFGGTTGNWASKPAHMLAIRAESHALRRAFPNDLSGIYTPEDFEDGHAEDNAVEDPRIAQVEAVTDVDELNRLRFLWQSEGKLTEALFVAMATRAGVLRAGQQEAVQEAEPVAVPCVDPEPATTPEAPAQHRYDPEAKQWTPAGSCPVCGGYHDASVHDA
jgi:phage recombination protein Bet